MGYRPIGQGIRPVTVPATTAPNSVTPITAPCRLVGWSLAAANAAAGAKYNTVTSPGAGASVVTLGTVPPGEYVVSWQVELSGTLAIADQDNFKVQVGATGIVQSTNLPVAGVYAQQPLTIVVPAGGATVRIITNGAGTVLSVYAATISLTQVAGYQATLYDSGQPLGQSAAIAGQSDTQVISEDGAYVSTSVTITVLSGTVSGVIWICDYEDYEQAES